MSDGETGGKGKGLGAFMERWRSLVALVALSVAMSIVIFIITMKLLKEPLIKS